MVKIDIEYQSNLRCEARHGPSGGTLHTDAPVDNNGKGESFSPTDLVATALGSCMLTIMGIVGERMGVDIKGAKVSVDKHMVADPKRRIRELAVHIHNPVKLSERDQKKFERAALTCPVHKSLHPDIKMPIVFEWL